MYRGMSTATARKRTAIREYAAELRNRCRMAFSRVRGIVWVKQRGTKWKRVEKIEQREESR
jgi:hypothetical protein